MTRFLPSKKDVLALLASDGQPLDAREIAARLGVGDDSYPGFLRMLDDLTFHGELIAGAQTFRLARGSNDARNDPPAPRAHARVPVAATRRDAAAPIQPASEEATPRERPEPRERERPASRAERYEKDRAGSRLREQPRKESDSAPPRARTANDRAASSGERADNDRKGAQARSGPSGKEREGVITIAPRGFGFVSSVGASGDDVFIAPESLKGAMHGDIVRILVRARGSRGAEGEVIAIVTRSLKRVAGVLRRRGRSAWLEPDDPRIRGPIILPSDVDAKAGEGNSGNDGDAAVVSIVRFPELPDENPEGKLEAVLGRPGELSVEVAKVLVREQVAEVHSEEAVAEAESYGETVPEAMLEGREDLTHLPLPTIDPEDARDHDDAVWVERIEDGGFRAWIAIADVSTYVRPGTRLDDEARARGCSIYLPDRAIPMLPRALSSNLCSLLPDVVRLCLCAEVDIDARGTVRKRRLIRGFMNSRAKLTYGGVARALGLTEATPRDPKADELASGLRVAYDLSRILRQKRMKRGAIDLDLPEAKIVIGEGGIPTDIQRRAQDLGTKKAYQLIEELMLLGNEVVAGWLVEHKVPTIFRVHAPPDEAKLVRFSTMCEALGIEFDLETAQDPKKLNDLLKSFADHPKANVLNMLLLRSMKQATYDVTNIGHFGLASKAYLHFTSPIRRYPDDVVHRSVHSMLLGEKIVREGKAVDEIAEAALASSIAERKAMEVEREVVDLYRAIFMRDKIGEQFEGTVTAVVGSGVFVVLDEPFVDVLVRFDDLGGEAYALDDDGLRAIAERSGDVVQLGDRMRVEIVDVGIQRRSVYGRRIRVGSDGEIRPHVRRGERSGKLPPRDANAKGRGAGGKPERAGRSGRTQDPRRPPFGASATGKPKGKGGKPSAKGKAKGGGGGGGKKTKKRR